METWNDLKEDEQQFLLFMLLNDGCAEEEDYKRFLKPIMRRLGERGWIDGIHRFVLTDYAREQMEKESGKGTVGRLEG
jgi:hypothetical protein